MSRSDVAGVADVDRHRRDLLAEPLDAASPVDQVGARRADEELLAAVAVKRVVGPQPAEHVADGLGQDEVARLVPVAVVDDP